MRYWIKPNLLNTNFFSIKSLDNSINNVTETLQSYVYEKKQTEVEIKQMQIKIQNQNHTLKHFQENLNITEGTLNMEIHNMSSRG